MTQRKHTPTYTAEFRARGVRLFKENRANYSSDNAAYRAIASKLGCSPDSLRAWCQQRWLLNGTLTGPQIVPSRMWVIEGITRIYDASSQRYGARKVWHALRREGNDIARCTVERLMKAMEIQGVVRGGKVITTNPDAVQPCPDDKVNREFVAPVPNRLWVSDFTYVSSWQGMVYVAFVIDVFARKIVGWRVSTSMTTSFVLPSRQIAAQSPAG